MTVGGIPPYIVTDMAMAVGGIKVNLGTGLLTLVASETLDATPPTKVDPSLISIGNRTSVWGVNDHRGGRLTLNLTGAAVVAADAVAAAAAAATEVVAAAVLCETAFFAKLLMRLKRSSAR